MYKTTKLAFIFICAIGAINMAFELLSSANTFYNIVGFFILLVIILISIKL